MITVSLFGGLGNQMFQYAAGKALAERRGVDLKLDVSGFRAYPSRSYLLDRLNVPETAGDVGDFFRARWRARIDNLAIKVGLPKLPSSSREYREPYFHFDRAFETLGPDTALFGYFQSERYFSSIADKIRGYFMPRDAFGAAAQSIANKIAISPLPVSIHIRRGDYLHAATAAVHGLLDQGYYRKAMAAIQDRAGQAPDFFIFSDDMDAAAKILDFVPATRITYVKGDAERPWEDMSLIARCRHHVIANSSFSWWGAWLNQLQDKIVIAPQAWFTEKGLSTRDTRDLYPSGWICL